MTDLIHRAAVLEILNSPQSWDTFPDMIRRVEALEGCGAFDRTPQIISSRVTIVD